MEDAAAELERVRAILAHYNLNDDALPVSTLVERAAQRATEPAPDPKEPGMLGAWQALREHTEGRWKPPTEKHFRDVFDVGRPGEGLVNGGFVLMVTHPRGFGRPMGRVAHTLEEALALLAVPLGPLEWRRWFHFAHDGRAANWPLVNFPDPED